MKTSTFIHIYHIQRERFTTDNLMMQTLNDVPTLSTHSTIEANLLCKKNYPIALKIRFSCLFFCKMPSRKTKKFRRDRTEISCCLKYSIFCGNLLCWVTFSRFETCLQNFPRSTSMSSIDLWLMSVERRCLGA